MKAQAGKNRHKNPWCRSWRVNGVVHTMPSEASTSVATRKKLIRGFWGLLGLLVSLCLGSAFVGWRRRVSYHMLRRMKERARAERNQSAGKGAMEEHNGWHNSLRMLPFMSRQTSMMFSMCTCELCVCFSDARPSATVEEVHMGPKSSKRMSPSSRRSFFSTCMLFTLMFSTYQG